MVGNVLASGALALGLIIFGRTILSLWLGEAEAEASTEALWYLTIAYWLLAINVVPHFILLAVGRMRFVAMSNLAAGIVLLVAMLVLVQPYGLVGVAVARIVYGVIILVNVLSLIEETRSLHAGI
jgi:O-antigen/teichoic acid export membrane protein